jgi:hypothetical protein
MLKHFLNRGYIKKRSFIGILDKVTHYTLLRTTAQ